MAAVCSSSSPTRHITPASRTPSPAHFKSVTPYVLSPLSSRRSSPVLLISSTQPSFDPSLSPPSSPSRREAKKMFVCTGYGNCTMAFSRSEHLARHIRKHTGERPFKCHCGRDFSRLDNLRQHAQTVHADQPDANASMMSRLMAVHNQLSAQTSTKKRKANSTSPPTVPKNASPSVSQGLPNGMPLLPPAPIQMASFHGGSSTSGNNYIATPVRSSANYSEPYMSFDAYHGGPPSPYINQGAYSLYTTHDMEPSQGHSLPSLSSFVPRQMHTVTTSMPYSHPPVVSSPNVYSGHTVSSYNYADSPQRPVVTSRPQSYMGSPAPFQASVLQPFTTAQAELYESDAVSMAGSPALSYVHTPVQALPSPALQHFSTVGNQPRPNGKSDDGLVLELPQLDYMNGHHSNYSSPSPTQHSINGSVSRPTKGIDELMPAEFFLSQQSATPNSGSDSNSLSLPVRVASPALSTPRSPATQYPNSMAVISQTQNLDAPTVSPTSYTSYSGYVAPSTLSHNSVQTGGSPLKRLREDEIYSVENGQRHLLSA